MKIRRGLYFLFAAASLVTAIVSCLYARSLSNENKLLKALASEDNRPDPEDNEAPVEQQYEIDEPTAPQNSQIDISAAEFTEPEENEAVMPEAEQPQLPEDDEKDSAAPKDEQNAVIVEEQTDDDYTVKDRGKYIIIINKKSKKYHTGKCRAAQNTSSANRLVYHAETRGGSEEDHRFLESLGYTRCGICK